MNIMNRRKFIKSSLCLPTLYPSIGLARINDPDTFKTVKLNNQNTNEKVKVVFWRNGWFDKDAFEEIEYFFRDWRENKTHNIDPYLIDALHKIGEESGGDKEIVILSGYRTPKTNNWLVNHPKYRAAENSLHTYGRAVDFTLPNRRLYNAGKFARSLQVGGVGYYPNNYFIHVDTGKVRYWRS